MKEEIVLKQVETPVELERKMQLNSLDLHRSMINSKLTNYLGDFPINQLPNLPSSSSTYCFISNTDPSWERGTHWFAIVQPPNNASLLLMLDPLGIPLHRILQPLRSWIGLRKVKTIPYRIQPLASTSCGAYCVYLLEKLPLYNYDIDKLVTTHFDENDMHANHNKIYTWWMNHSAAL